MDAARDDFCQKLGLRLGARAKTMARAKTRD